ncbi:MAG TPA: hypothetical protein VLC53_02010 [Myxococcota bacterium]|nr:hypothetical protein [Myxococcota bacterium]
MPSALSAPSSAPDPLALSVAPRFCGPPGAGNGGYVAGRLVALAGLRGPVEVTLRRPAPVGVPLALRPPGEGDGEAWALEGVSGERIAEARPHRGPLHDAPPALPGAASVARLLFAEEPHPFPHCFVCGPARAAGDGLRILPRPVPGAALAAALWTPAAELAGPGGFVDPAFVWAALDCPGYFGATLGGPRITLLLGRMTAVLSGPVRAGARLRVLGWPLAREGRRHIAATALVDESGRVVARSRQVWIAPLPEPR